MTIATLEETHTDKFGFKGLAGGQIQVVPGWGEEELGRKLVQLFDVANSSGLFVAAGNDDAFVVGKLSDLHEIGFTSEFKKSLEDKVTKHKLNGKPSHVGFTSDEKSIYAGVDGELRVFATDKPDTQLKSIVLGDDIAQVLPNPRVASDAAVVTANGSLFFLDLAKGTSKRIEVPESVTRASWSPKGKQLVAGTSGNCSIYQLRPDGSTAAVVEAPTNNEDEVLSGTAEVTEILWLETHLFFVSYSKVDDEDTESSSYLIFRDKNGPTTYKKAEEDLSPPFGDASRGRSWFSAVLRDYAGLDYLIATNFAPSTEITMLTKDEILRATDDSMNATMPYTDFDTSAIGIGLDVTSKDDVDTPIPGASTSDPLPLLWILNNEGRLAGWHIVSLDGIKQHTAGVEPLQKAISEAAKEASTAASLFGGDGGSSQQKTASPSPFAAGPGTASPFAAGASPFAADASPFAAGASGSPFAAGASKLSFSNFKNPTLPDEKPKSENTPTFGSSKFGDMKFGNSSFGSSSFGSSGPGGSGGAFGAKVTFGSGSNPKEPSPVPEAQSTQPTSTPTIQKMDDDSDDEGHNFKFDESMADDLEPTTEGDQTDQLLAALAKDDAPAAKDAPSKDGDSALFAPLTAQKGMGLTSRHAKAKKDDKKDDKEDDTKPVPSFGFNLNKTSASATGKSKFGSQATGGSGFTFGKDSNSESPFLAAAASNPFAGKGFFGSTEKKDEAEEKPKTDSAASNEPKITELSSGDDEGESKKSEQSIADKPKELQVKDQSQPMERVSSREKTPIKELIKKFDSSSSQDLNKEDLQKLKAASGQTKSTPEVAVEDEDDEQEDDALEKLDQASFAKHTTHGKSDTDPAKFDDDAQEKAALEKLDEAGFAKEASSGSSGEAPKTSVKFDDDAEEDEALKRLNEASFTKEANGSSNQEGDSSFAQFDEDDENEFDEFDDDYEDYEGEFTEENVDEEDEEDADYVHVHDERNQTESIDETYEFDDGDDEHDDDFDNSVVDPSLKPPALPVSGVYSGFEPASSLPAAAVERAPMVSTETQTEPEPEPAHEQPEPEPEPEPFAMPLPVPSMKMFEDSSTETPKTLGAAMEQIYLEVESEFETLTENYHLLETYLRDQDAFQEEEYALSITEVEKWRLGGAYELANEVFEELEKVSPYAAKFEGADDDINKCNKGLGVLEYKIARYQSLRPKEEKEEVLRQRALSAREQKLKNSLRVKTEKIRSDLIDLEATVTQMKAQTIFLNGGTYSTSTTRIQDTIGRITENFRERLANLDAIEATETLDNLSLASAGDVKAITTGDSSFVGPDESSYFIVPSDAPFANSFRQLMGGRQVM
ncbi:YALIA101S05e01662g1_1 [Yarrowia lipolytica]|nr:Nucleoporin [Yarrowia lipolytica]SEI34407.1 YALIA101S05e01662g1_1 [Yarrowia lipolytica]VBB79264.1 Conserved hypothetical protein [Yarrowia lipolytica]